MSEIPIPLTFRSEIIKPLAGKLQDGYCCSLVGVGSSGKSNVVRHLKKPEVRKHYFGEQAASRILYLYLDLDGLESYTSHVVYAKLLRVLADELVNLPGDTRALETTLEAQWREILTTSSELLAHDSLERGIKRVLTQHADKVIFVFDDCDTLIEKVEGSLLRSLRALRNDHKGKLLYITVSRRELNQVRGSSPDFETFFELFASNLIFVGPYREVDARGMIERLAARNNEATRPLTEQEIQRLVQLSGGHAGLISCVYQVTNRSRDPLAVDIMASGVVNTLLGKTLVRTECGKILASLSKGETAALRQIAAGQMATGASLTVLIRKGLVLQNIEGPFTIFSPIMREFVMHPNNTASAGANVPPRPETETASAHTSSSNAAPEVSSVPLAHIDHGTRSVGIGAVRAQLAPAEFEVFLVLYHKEPHPCSSQELLKRIIVPPGKDQGEFLDDQVRSLNKQYAAAGILIQKSSDGRYRMIGNGK